MHLRKSMRFENVAMFHLLSAGPVSMSTVCYLTIHLVFPATRNRSEEHTSELQSLMRISYAVFCLKKKKKHQKNHSHTHTYHKHICTYKTVYTEHQPSNDHRKTKQNLEY